MELDNEASSGSSSLSNIQSPTGSSALSHDSLATSEDNFSSSSQHKSATRALDVSGEVQLRDNFPIPRELRDIIYGLLLEARLNRHENPKPHYHLSPAILRVNRTLYEEAREVLYKANTLIIVSYRTHIWEDNPAFLQLPIIASSKLGAIKDHTMRFHLESRKLKCFCGMCGSDEKGPPKSFLIVAEDFPAVCRLLRVQNFRIAGNANMITSARNEKSLRWEKVKGSARLLVKVGFQQTSYGAPSLELQKSLLNQLRSAVGISHKVSIAGAVDPLLAAECSQAMMPKVVMAYAMGWDLYSLMRSLKDEADAHYMAERLTQAFALYETVAELTSTHIVPPYSTFADTCACKDWQTGIDRLQWDSLIMACLVGLRIGCCPEQTMDFVMLALEISHGNPRLPAYAYLLSTHLLAVAEAEEGDLDHSLELLHRVDALRAEHPGLYDDNCLQDDLEMAEAYVAKLEEPEEEPEEEEEPSNPPFCYASSSFAMLFDDDPIDTPFRGEPPEGLAGWFDTHHQLSKEDMQLVGIKNSG
ncbi:hypothetical protein W97_00464 [Coniosporium apollinis CBS 100218]|uniref:Uncharacterized protein n=1 Tax=Coniosporium apollinis (strain CBS 100218) TaxID=1168221 RepID=R7YHY1_CONA1|nr:uncharacterized protein W97_00464 [Coniosporium apollinis CBS 100218]EON61251.1 hypothetical protein W97_00464 [Coniosporium apollinis CBS 100218]